LAWASALRVSPRATATSARHRRSSILWSIGAIFLSGGTCFSRVSAWSTAPARTSKRTESIVAIAASSVSPTAASRSARAAALVRDTLPPGVASAAFASARILVSAATSAQDSLSRLVNLRRADSASVFASV
jgi:hypothetical protein